MAALVVLVDKQAECICGLRCVLEVDGFLLEGPLHGATWQAPRRPVLILTHSSVCRPPAAVGHQSSAASLHASSAGVPNS